MQESTRRRRARGGGTAYRVGDCWRGSIFVRDEAGKRTRRYVSGESQADVLARLRSAQADATAAAELAGSPTLAWWANRWLGAVRLRVRPATFALYRQAMTLHAVPALGDRTLVQLRASDVETFLARLVAEGMAPSTAALTRSVLVVCLSDAVRDGRVPANVARAARSPRVEPVERRRLTPAETRALLALAADDPRTDALVALGIGTGARVGELCALDWSDVDLDAGTVTIRGTLARDGRVGPPKSSRGRRTVALPGFALAALHRQRERRAEDGPVLTDPAGRRLSTFLARQLWRELRDRAGLDGLWFHDLRGTAATLALAAGVPPTEVARSLGHDPAVLMRTYASAIPGGRGLVADAIEKAIGG
jgi:integrase